MRPTALFSIIVCFLAHTVISASTTFDPDPQHPWNRLDSTLFVRTDAAGQKYGADELDILYWFSTKHLLEGESHSNALKALDDFLNTADTTVVDPWKRALLQRRLWQLFDWAARAPDPTTKPHHDLQIRLVKAINRIALSENEIQSLPDNASFLPKDLQDKSAWIQIDVNSAESVASTHLFYFGGRSTFTVMFRHSEGRQAGVDYLARLSAFSPFLIGVTNCESGAKELDLNPDLPQFPVGSQWALVRRLCLIDSNGRIRPTRVIESIQLRTYNIISKISFESREQRQTFSEYRMSADANFRLVPVQSGEKHFEPIFFSKGIDAFEATDRNPKPEPARWKSETLTTCGTCHNGIGIQSVHTFTRAFALEQIRQTPKIIEAKNSYRDNDVSIEWKKRHFTWGLYQGISSR